MRRTVALTLLALCVTSARGVAQTYVDRSAESLHRAAMAEHERLDRSVESYTAVVRQRTGVALRMPLKDRLLYRSEGSHRLWWNRDGENLVQVLGFREQTPAGVNREDIDFDRFDVAFDPMDDRLFFGFASRDEDLGEPGDDEFWFEHPLYPEYVDHYRFSTGDTITLSLPDGRRVLAVELKVVPTEADVHRMTGALWIEPESGALVRAVYRLSDTFDAFRDIPDLQEEEDDDLRFIPGMLKPWTADISMISVDYALWDFEVWMPRSMRIDGVVAAGILKVPLTVDFSYEMESVTTVANRERGESEELPVVHFRTRSEAMAYLNELAFGEEVPYRVGRRSRASDDGPTRYIMPEDLEFLGESPQLPPPIWESAPGFSSEAELRTMFDAVADLPDVPLPQVPATLRWGLQRPDLLRYNRVEALSVGARGQIRPRTFLGPLSVTATARLGVADLEPNGRLDLTRETLRRRFMLSGYSELASIDEEARHLGIGNSIMAAFFGRDDGDYYRRSGASLEWTPPSALRRTFRIRGYSEYHRPAAIETQFALFRFWNDTWAYRPNLVAEEGWEHGVAIDVNPWWGTDPRLVQGGIDILAQAGTGVADYARTSLVGRLVFPLGSDLRFAVEAGGGAAVGAPTPQRLWHVGGTRTLRGYPPRVASGDAFGRARAELARTFSFGSVSLFSDYAWAGSRDELDLSNGLHSVGIGVSLLDGLIRLDGAHGLVRPRDFRLEFYLDAIL